MFNPYLKLVDHTIINFYFKSHFCISKILASINGIKHEDKAAILTWANTDFQSNSDVVFTWDKSGKQLTHLYIYYIVRVALLKVFSFTIELPQLVQDALPQATFSKERETETKSGKYM